MKNARGERDDFVKRHRHTDTPGPAGISVRSLVFNVTPPGTRPDAAERSPCRLLCRRFRCTPLLWFGRWTSSAWRRSPSTPSPRSPVKTHARHVTADKWAHTPREVARHYVWASWSVAEQTRNNRSFSLTTKGGAAPNSLNYAEFIYNFDL